MTYFAPSMRAYLRGLFKGASNGRKLSLDLFWIKDQSLTDTDSLPAPDIIATEIADELETALEMFTKIAAKLSQKSPLPRSHSPK